MDYLRPLTLKESRFLKLYFETGKVAEAALESKLYVKPKRSKAKESSHKISAASLGSRVLRELGPQIEEMLDAAGLSKMEVLHHLKEGLESHETVRVRVRGEDGKENTEIQRHPDFKARSKYVEMALKVHQILVNTPSYTNINQTRVEQNTAILNQHRESLEGKSVDEITRIIEEEGRARASIRLIGSGAKR